MATPRPITNEFPAPHRRNQDLAADELLEPLLGEACGSRRPPGGAAAECKRIMSIGGPMLLEEVTSYAASLVALGMVGRLGASALGAYSLAHSLTNITGIALLNGVTGAVDTFSSQANGSGAYPAIGLTLQRALMVSLATCVPLLALYAAAGPVLRSLGQQAALAAAAARYVRLFAPVVPLHGVTLCLYRTLASQGATLYILAATTAFFAATPPLHWLLIFRLGLGLDGSALASVACEALYMASLAALCCMHNMRRPPGQRWWRGWSGDALRGWRPFLKLSLAATAMIVADWWLYDILTLLAGLLPSPDVPVAASGILYNINTIVFMVPYGLAFAVSARVGQQLGAAQSRGAQLSARLGTAMGLSIVGLVALASLLLRHKTAALFTPDPAVVEACGELMAPLALLMMTNGATALQSAALAGCGRQKRGAAVNAAANYALGLPLMLLFAFQLHRGVAGLWWGIAAASAVQAGVLLALVARFDWAAEAQRAQRLVLRLSNPAISSAAGHMAAAVPALPDMAAPLVRGV